MSSDTTELKNAHLLTESPYVDSVASLEQRIKNNPRDAESLLLLGHSYYLSGRIGLAIETLKKAVSVNPALAQAYYHLGVAYYRSAWLDEAISALAQAAKLAPEMIMTFYWLGIVYYHKGLYAESRKAFETMLASNREASIAHYHAALACIGDGALDQARFHLDALVQEGHGDPQVYLLLGTAHYRLHQVTEAIDTYRRGLAINPDDKALQSALDSLVNVQDP